jgi:hypothetical protein
MRGKFLPVLLVIAAAASGSRVVAQTCMLTVQSAPPTGIVISSDTGQSGTTNYTVPSVTYATSVDLTAPATDPTGEYVFSQWTVNNTPQIAGQQAITFTITRDTTAAAEYTPTTYTLTVQSTPLTGLTIGSSTGDGGTANYTVPSVAYGTSVDLTAPNTDASGNIFLQWLVNGQGKGPGSTHVQFTLTGATTALAQYVNLSTLIVQSTPPTGLSIGSSTGDGGTTNYTVPSVAYGTSVNLQAPAAGPTGYTFSQWTLNGAALTGGQKSVTFPAVPYATWGSYGSGNGQLDWPFGVAVDSSGNVYVADPWNNLVQKFTSAGAFLTQWGGFGWGKGQFDYPEGVAVDSSGNVYVADSGNSLIQKFTSAGAFLAQWGGYGRGNGQFDWPDGVAVDGSGNVYVADAGNDLIQKFTSAGAFIKQWGGSGSGDGQFNYPEAVAVDSSGNVYVADSGNDLIQKFASGGAFLSQWGGEGSGNGQFDWPGGVAADSAGNVYVADSGNDVIEKFTSAGTFIKQWGGSGSDNGQFELPWGLAVDSSGNVYVADAANSRIQAFYLNILAVAQYTGRRVGYTLSVQSTPPTKLLISSSTGQSGTTNYTEKGVAAGASVNLNAPATDPTGYAFAQWTVNGAPQTTGQKSVTFTMDAAVTAVAHYTANVGYALTVQSMPPTKLAISSSTGQGGMTNYTEKAVAARASVNLNAPATDPTGYTFAQWTVNGAPQAPGQKSVTFTMDSAVTAVAHYTAIIGYALTVQSAPPTGLSIGSSTGQSGTTNYTEKGVAAKASVNLEAPATDPTGYTFVQWTVNGAPRTPAQKSVTFTMDSAVTAVAHYTANVGYALTVQSAPPAGLGIGSSTGQSGTTNYTEKRVAAGASVNLQAPATGGTGYAFSQWTLNGAAQKPGEKSVTFTMHAPVTAVAHYTANVGYALTVQSAPPIGLGIGSSSGQGGATDYTETRVAAGASVNLQAPATDPAGYTFAQWTLNGAAQKPGEKSVTFTMAAAVTAVAHYTANVGYALTVQSAPPIGLGIGSSTGQGGTTDYAEKGVAAGASVNLQAPPTDPAGYTFAQWTLNDAAQNPGEKSVTFTMAAAVTAVAQYTANVGYALTVESTPPGLSIGSSTGQSGTTNYTEKGVAAGASVNLQAPATDPAGHTFSQWLVNGAAQPAGQKGITFIMEAATTAEAVYTRDTP